jgi:4'-phosphopantetheinyl transferase EntD
MNPAAVSSSLGDLFPPGAVVTELREEGDPRLLLPEEAAWVARAVLKRVREFAAGRLCARRALAEFGIIDFPIRAAGDRQPIWPDAFVGGITHTAGFCAAVVAPRARFAALGIDTEIVGHVRTQIQPSICTPGEVAWIGSLPQAERAAAATLIFSAKEAFYKCQYPLVAERLRFHDVSVEALPWCTSAGALRIHPLRRLLLDTHALPLLGRYRFHEGFVTAGLAVAVAVAAAAPAQA